MEMSIYPHIYIYIYEREWTTYLQKRANFQPRLAMADINLTAKGYFCILDCVHRYKMLLARTNDIIAATTLEVYIQINP